MGNVGDVQIITWIVFGIPVNFTDADGGWDGFAGGPNSDDAWRDYKLSQAGVQNGFMNGDMDRGINGAENMALLSQAYNEYRAEHTNANGEWGYWITHGAVRDLGDETYSCFVVDPNTKKENPVLFKLSQLNGGGLDFSGAKFGMSGYENLPWYKTKVDVFGTNAAKSAWNQVVDIAQASANGIFSSDGRKDIFAGVDNLVKGTMNWLFTTSTDQKVDDILDASTNVRNYENLAGGLMLGGAMTRFSGIGIDPKVLNPFGLRGGYGVFGKNGWKIGNVKIEALYTTPGSGRGSGTIFSVKSQTKGGLCCDGIMELCIKPKIWVYIPHLDLIYLVIPMEVLHNIHGMLHIIFGNIKKGDFKKRYFRNTNSQC